MRFEKISVEIGKEVELPFIIFVVEVEFNFKGVEFFAIYCFETGSILFT